MEHSNGTRGSLYNHLGDGTTELFTDKNERILIDTEDFDKVREYNWIIRNGSVITTKNSKGKMTIISMSRLLIDNDVSEATHINGDKLDNRKANLSCGNSYRNLGGGVTEIYTSNNERILIDTEDYEHIKDYIWGLDNHGYVITHMNRINVTLPRFIMQRYQDIEGTDIAHINQSKLDNRKANLRVCKSSQDNIPTWVQSNNIHGVYYNNCTGNYVATITVNGVNIHLGSYVSLEETVRIRKEAELVHFGEYSDNKSNNNEF